jgi:hypothetical protein
MAKRKKAQPELSMELPRIPHGSQHARELRVRLPGDLASRIEKESHDSGRSQTRIVIDMLARVAQADESSSIASSARHLETILERYGTRLNDVILAETLLAAVDAVVNAPAAELQSKVDRLRIERRAMLEIERARSTRV